MLTQHLTNFGKWLPELLCQSCRYLSDQNHSFMRIGGYYSVGEVNPTHSSALGNAYVSNFAPSAVNGGSIVGAKLLDTPIHVFRFCWITLKALRG
jgi:hypothetical protein